MTPFGSSGPDGCEPDRHVAPAIAYRPTAGDSACAVSGGYAYRGRAGSLPQGTYLYGDHCSGAIWAVSADELVDGTATPVRVAQLPQTSGQLRSFGEDDDGELYVVTSGGDVLAIGSAASG